MTRMIRTRHVHMDALPRTFGARMTRMGRKVRRFMDTASVTAELFPPVVLVGGLALYFYILACIGNGGDGAAP